MKHKNANYFNNEPQQGSDTNAVCEFIDKIRATERQYVLSLELNVRGNCRRMEFELSCIRKAVKCHHLNLLLANFMVTPCLSNIHHFRIQLMDTTSKNIELLKHFKISKPAPTCFGLQGNHHQGATIST